MKTLAQLLREAQEAIELVQGRLEDEAQGLYESNANVDPLMDMMDSTLESLGHIREARNTHSAWLRGE
jgi:hypothetical protein